jgi:transcriptional regulator with XRE-family HTH domain
MGNLGAIVSQFRDRFHLSKAKASKVLGVSIQYVRSLETGTDVATGLPFRPRESTLRMLAEKMTEFGYPVTFDQLREAAWDNEGPGEQEVLTIRERRILERMGILDDRTHPLHPLSGSAVWELSPDERMRLLQRTERGWEATGQVLTLKELRLLDAIRELTDGDLESVNLGPQSSVWTEKPDDRIRELRTTMAELSEEMGTHAGRAET